MPISFEYLFQESDTAFAECQWLVVIFPLMNIVRFVSNFSVII